MRRWQCRCFGTEEPQRPPREGDYLGVPRLPRAAELSEPQVEPDTFKRPLGVPIPVEPLPDTVGDSIPADSMGLLRDTIRLDTLVRPVRDSIRPPVRDTLPPPGRPLPDSVMPDSAVPR